MLNYPTSYLQGTIIIVFYLYPSGFTLKKRGYQPAFPQIPILPRLTETDTSGDDGVWFGGVFLDVHGLFQFVLDAGGMGFDDRLSGELWHDDDGLSWDGMATNH